MPSSIDTALSATTAMTHIAIQERLEAKTTDRMEKGSDQQYQA